VGKTCRHGKPLVQIEKHPHGRGEDALSLYTSSDDGETPPRAWGRLKGISGLFAFDRNTPTGVGKTIYGERPPLDDWKHPHGRGEDLSLISLLEGREETPPRAWGRRGLHEIMINKPGNTPTGVGKTAAGAEGAVGAGKHPHGRGEDGISRNASGRLVETPPRAWGRRIA